MADEQTGDGFENAVVIDANTTEQGIAQEYTYVEDRYGIRGRDWTLIRQSLHRQDNRSYDLLRIQLKDGNEVTLYFDITNFFGTH